jgi:aspartyl-tRNA(Asn)/glutamyl-tRNA(Gln) amidotransferase subunit A
MGDDLAYLGADELARGYRSRAFSPVEATAAMLRRIEQANPALNAFLTLMADSALHQARQAEQDIFDGHSRGALHGVPVAIKDLYFTEGVPTTGGSPFFRHFRPSFDATVVARLKAAGAVIVGKTNLHELGYGVTNENPHFGVCRNPWDLTHIPGGSSGGSAVAVAAGLSAVSYGTDTGGSIRIPASYCGVTAFKPTFGRVSRHGVIPLSVTLDHVGSFGRSVRDVAVATEAVGGPDRLDTSCLRSACPQWSDSLSVSIRGWRVGLVTGSFVHNVCPEVEAGIAEAARQLTGAGAEVEPMELPRAFEVGEVAHLVQMADGAAVHHRRLQEQPEQFSEDVRLLIEQGHLVSAVDYINAQRLRRIFQQELHSLFDRFRALLLPATPIAAPLIGQDGVPWSDGLESVGGASTRLVRPFTFAGVPVLTVPCGFTRAGLPFGMQLVARAGDELSALQLGTAYQDATSWHLRRPPPSADQKA